jgi:hypothetical protein
MYCPWTLRSPSRMQAEMAIELAPSVRRCGHGACGQGRREEAFPAVGGIRERDISFPGCRHDL